MVITNLREIFFKTIPEFSKAFQSMISKHHIQLSHPVKNLLRFIYFKELLEIGARLIQIEQILQLVKNYYTSGQLQLLQIGAIVITNRGSSSYYKSGQNYYKLRHLLQVGTELLQIGQVLQIGAIITNRCRTVVTRKYIIMIRNKYIYDF